MLTALQQLQAHFEMGYATAAPLPQASAQDLAPTEQVIVGYFEGLELHSHFQPLLHAHKLKPLAHEALLRPCTPGQLHFQPPHSAFTLAHNAQTSTYLDRLCRVVHAMNFVRQSPGPEQRLFLNVSAQHLQSVSHSHGEAFEGLLRLCGLKPQQVVLEILEAGVDDLALLQTAVQGWRQRGFQIAIDDFGCQHSNFDRLWQLTPDIVKLDRQLVQQALHNPRAARILPQLIQMIHELDASVVCEGIESATQHQLCVDAGSDMLQGFFYARPSAQLHHRPALQA